VEKWASWITECLVATNIDSNVAWHVMAKVYDMRLTRHTSHFHTMTYMARVMCHFQGGPEKNAQTSMHHHFATVSNKVTCFSPKYSEINR